MKLLRSQRGISLLEVLASVGLFTVVATGLTTSLTANTKISNGSRTIAAGTALVQNKLEQLRMIVPVTNTVPADLTLGVHNDPQNPITSLDAPNGTFTRSWSVSTVRQYLSGVDVGARPGIVQIAVTVSWTKPQPGSYTAVTFACTTQVCG